MLESAVTEIAERHLGRVAEIWREGRAGTFLRTARVLTPACAVTAALAEGHSRPAAVAGALALLGDSVCTCFGVIAAGLLPSAEDPKCTVVPKWKGA
ncbi:hypothetical protein [Streptomyces sp. NPDC096934]|uniref:hypothetical protein n=1 Tax=Streptomyces sp. NPDC096934 TaxID=3155551 RepID=UPI00331E6C97